MPSAVMPAGRAPATIDLGREEWGRWALQQAHHELPDDGQLVLTAPNLLGLGTLEGIAFLLGRVPREIGLRLRRLLRLPAPRERFRERRYRLDALTRMLETLGFVVESISARDFGWLRPFARLLRRPERVAGTWVIRCRRGPSLFGLDPRRPFPDPETHRRRFEREHRPYLEDRNRWLERYPQHRPPAVSVFDPAIFGGASVLVLAPHPDDELIGCGGTLIRLIAAGAKVTVIHATDGSEAASLWHAADPLRRTVRLEEARRVGDALGFEELIFWREDNARFRERAERVRELAEVLERLRPALIFTPFVTDVHPDHRVLSRMLARALGAAPHAAENARVFTYQVWSLLPPNTYCGVADVMGQLERALFIYPTAMKVDDYVHFCQDRNYYDAVTQCALQGFVEAYFQIAATRFCELMKTPEASRG